LAVGVDLGRFQPAQPLPVGLALGLAGEPELGQALRRLRQLRPREVPQNHRRQRPLIARQVGVIEESILHKLDLVVEGQQALAGRMDRMDIGLQKLDERLTRVEVRLTRVETKVDGLETKVDGLGAKIDRAAADLSAHRADTEAHRGAWRVREE
jgi:outer membrane murein-binding lipoprotein Lpp